MVITVSLHEKIGAKDMNSIGSKIKPVNVEMSRIWTRLA
jgi:hypothetical protein